MQKGFAYYCGPILARCSKRGGTLAKHQSSALIVIQLGTRDITHNAVAPESWATASVYLFLQNLRKLVGVEAAASAKQDLRVVHVDEKESRKLAQRGDTWRPNSQTGNPDLADLLATLFAHPANAKKINDAREHLDPDAHVFAEPKGRPNRDWARGAMLFGPPGTSKTSLVSAIAASIGWPLIEVHASHFLQEGLDRIPARADWIFARLMELDRCYLGGDSLLGRQE
ncbi:MAG TPA: AAA family ATPase, partial [Kofleriaceae bacterium]